MIDVSKDQLLTMAQAAAMLPNRPSLCALWRWRTRGVRGRRLEAVLIGGTPYTTVEALARFAQQQGGEVATIRSPRQRGRAIERATKELADSGI